jgi:hypothetical protein
MPDDAALEPGQNIAREEICGSRLLHHLFPEGNRGPFFAVEDQGIAERHGAEGRQLWSGKDVRGAGFPFGWRCRWHDGKPNDEIARIEAGGAACSQMSRSGSLTLDGTPRQQSAYQLWP